MLLTLKDNQVSAKVITIKGEEVAMRVLYILGLVMLLGLAIYGGIQY